MSGCILKVKPTGFAEGPDVDMRERCVRREQQDGERYRCPSARQGGLQQAQFATAVGAGRLVPFWAYEVYDAGEWPKDISTFVLSLPSTL